MFSIGAKILLTGIGLVPFVDVAPSAILKTLRRIEQEILHRMYSWSSGA